MQKRLLCIVAITACIFSMYGMEKKKKKGKTAGSLISLRSKAQSVFSHKNNVDLQENDEIEFPLELRDIIKDFMVPGTFNDGLSLLNTIESISNFALCCKAHKSLVDESKILETAQQRISAVSDIAIFLEAISLLEKPSKLKKRPKVSVPKQLQVYLNNLLKNVQKMDDLINSHLPSRSQVAQAAFKLFDCGLRPDFVLHRRVYHEKYDKFLISYIYAPYKNNRVLKILHNHENISVDCINSLSKEAFIDLKKFKLKLTKELLVELINKGLEPNFQFVVGYEARKAPLLVIAMKYSPQDLDVIRLLLDKGANPNYKFNVSYDKGNSTPFLIAKRRYPEIFRLFQEYKPKSVSEN